MSARIFISRDSGALCVGAEEVAHGVLQSLRKRAASMSRSSAPARAACIGWSRWSKSRPTKAGSATGRSRRAISMRCSMPACSTASRTVSASASSTTIHGSRARRGSPSRIAASSIRAASKITKRMAVIGAWPRRSPSGRRRSSRRSLPPACAAEAARASPPASNGARWPTPRPSRNTSSATPTKAIPAPSPTA